MTTTIRYADLVDSVAAALQYISYYHPADYIAHLARAYEAEQSPAARDATNVQQVVEQQLKAFATEDAGQAFALADPTLRTRFSTAQEFLETVRTQYPMVAHPISVLFLKPESDGSIALQKVRVTDTEGAAWMVTYLLNRTGTGQWLISGTLVEPDGVRVQV